MAGAFLWDDKVRVAASLVSVAGAPVATLPVSNLVDAQPRMRARWLGSVASILADLGAVTAIAAVALISTNLPAGATIRWRSGPAESLAEAAAVFDMRLTDPAAVAYPAGWTFGRSSLAWCFDSTGTLVQVAADTPRFDYDPATRLCRGMLLEEGRTNGVRNPRAEGGVAASPGTNPTNWGSSGSALTRTIVGFGTEAGIPYIDVRYAGTAGSSGNHTLSFEAATQIAAASGQTWTLSMFARLVGGSTANLTAVQQTIVEVDSGGSTLATNAQTFVPSSLAAFGTVRPSYTVTLANASTAYARPQLRLTFNNGAVVDITLRIGLPQLEQGSMASSPILPPAGSPATSTRAPDRAYVSGLAIPAAGASLLVQGQCTAGAGQTIVPAGMGPPNDFPNSTYFAVTSAGTCSLGCLAGGVSTSPASIAGSNGAAMTLAAGVSPAGSYFARNAAATAIVAGFAMPATMDRVSLGGAPWGSGAAIGEAVGVSVYQRLALYYTRLLDTQVAALATTGSSLVTAALVYDSGTVAASPDALRGNVVLLAPTDVAARYLQVDVVADFAAMIDLGRLVAGPLWRPSRAMAYGFQEGSEILDRRDRNPFTAAEFPVPALANPRLLRFSLPLLTPAEIAGQFRSMMAAIGAAGDALWMPDTGLSRSELNARSVWGAVAAPGEDAAASRDSFPGNNRAFRIVERV